MARILIIEDEIDLANLYRMALERRGHRVLGTFDDPGEAVAAGAVPEPPDLVLLDERLHGLSGTSHLGAIRAAYPGACVVLATADPEVAVRGGELGVDDVVRKPFSVRDLAARIDRLTGTI